MTHITLSIDDKVKKQVGKRAQQDGLSASAVMRLLLRKYAQGQLQIDAVSRTTENGFTPEFEQETLTAIRDAEAGKVSKTFSSTKALIADLHKKTKRV